MEVITKTELFERYGYLMDKEHGKDTELLMDIMKECGIQVDGRSDAFVIIE